MPWIEIGKTDVYYVDEGSGPPLVFLHGMSSCGEAWFQQFAHFSDRYRCIAYDSVNHGHSSNSPRDTPEPDRADELEAFLAALGIERPILAGNSMGGSTLLRWAARHPSSAAALVPSGMGIAPAPPAGAASGAPAAVGPPAAVAPQGPRGIDPETLFLPIGDSLTEGFRERQPRMYERYLRIRSTATRIEAMRHPRRGTAGRPGRAELAELIAKVTSPMLVVCGSLDRLLPMAQRLHEVLPSSRLEVIDGAPHNVYYEAAAEYNRLVDGFLASIPAG